MSISSEVKPIAGLKLKTNAFVDRFGCVSTQHTDYSLGNILEVINGCVEDVIHLVGHQIDFIHNLLTDGILSVTEEVNRNVEQFPIRRTASYLIQQKNQLFGIIVDISGKASVAGIVCHVIPDPYIEDNAIKISNNKENEFCFCNTKDLDLKSLISNGDIVGVIGTGGHLFLQITGENNNSGKMPELVLILQNGFFIIEKSHFVWNYPKFNFSIGETTSSSVTLEEKDCIVASFAGCVRSGKQFTLYGSGAAIIGWEQFLEFSSTIQNIDISIDSESIESEEDLDSNEEVDQQMDDISECSD